MVLDVILFAFVDDIQALKKDASNLTTNVKVVLIYSLQTFLIKKAALQCFVKCIGELQGLVSEEFLFN
jgi:hypothetical protein